MCVDKQSAGSVSVHNLLSEVMQSPVWIVQLVAARGLQWRQMTSVLANSATSRHTFTHHWRVTCSLNYYFHISKEYLS